VLYGSTAPPGEGTGSSFFGVIATAPIARLHFNEDTTGDDIGIANFRFAVNDAIDSNGDGVLDSNDNCPQVPNAAQTDTDEDGQGDACDVDDDNDTVVDVSDNCPLHANPDQANNDQDTLGDVCDTDDDNDGILDGADRDGDGVDDPMDNCPLVPNPGQDDTDNDGQGDVCDADDDNDGVSDGNDNCPVLANPNQRDTDGDGQGDGCDGDGDGVPNTVDNCPLIANTSQNDFDGDGVGDACDSDIDDDGVANGTDTCAFTPLDDVVDPATGCSIDQLAPCEGPRGTTEPWKNHGQYVAAVTQSANYFVKSKHSSSRQPTQAVANSKSKGFSGRGEIVCGSLLQPPLAVPTLLMIEQ
jgi:Thrombospondin type 3 repeat